jgi:hypothetical protein
MNPHRHDQVGHWLCALYLIGSDGFGREARSECSTHLHREYIFIEGIDGINLKRETVVLTRDDYANRTQCDESQEHYVWKCLDHAANRGSVHSAASKGGTVCDRCFSIHLIRVFVASSQTQVGVPRI